MRRNLKRGMTGPAVRKLQETLNTQGYRLPLTGIFGKQTDEVVRKFQTVRGLVPDGIVGYRTRRALGMDRKPVHPSGSGHSPQPDKGSSHPAGHPSHPAGPAIDPFGSASCFLRNLSELARRLGCDIADLLESARKARARDRAAPKPAPSQPPASAPVGKPTPPPAQAPVERPTDERLQDVTGMHLSKKGKQFIYTHEAVKGISNRLHWPGGASGVTLGPGYDMKRRTTLEIKRDLMAIGVDEVTSGKVSKAAGLRNKKAEDFAEDNHDVVYLSEKQEMRLLDRIAPKYENDVKECARGSLKQSQFDALVSYAYNPAYEFSAVIELVNDGKIANAMAELRKRVKSKGKVMKSLVNRRNYEIKLFLYGDYGKLHVVKE